MARSLNVKESTVKREVKNWLTACGAYYYMPVSNGLGRVGAPDFIVCIAGRFVGIETKAPGKRGNTTPNQEREIQWINRAGGFAFVVDNVKQLEVLRPLIGAHHVNQAGVQEGSAEPEGPAGCP